MLFEKYLFPFLHLQKHYSLKIGETLYIYVYIRKNACTAFKKFLIGESEYADQYDGKHPLEFLRKNHKPNIGDLYRCNTKSIVVIRDPIKRLISVYINKFVQCNGNKDVFKSYLHLTGNEPKNATFREFLTKYVQSNPPKKLDRHLLPQIEHLHKAVYNAPVRLESLHEDMCRVVGDYYADKYFRRKVNVSSDNVCQTQENTFDVPAVELAMQYKKTGCVPSVESFICQELLDTVESVYRMDNALYRDLNNAYERIPDDETPCIDVLKYYR